VDEVEVARPAGNGEREEVAVESLDPHRASLRTVAFPELDPTVDLGEQEDLAADRGH
jgi:hypothetical protein